MSEDGKRGWFGLRLADMDPAYVIALIAAAAVAYFQVQKLDNSVERLEARNGEISAQLIRNTAANEAMSTRFSEKMADIVDQFNRFSNNYDSEMEKLKDAIVRDRVDTNRRLDQIENAINRLDRSN